MTRTIPATQRTLPGRLTVLRLVEQRCAVPVGSVTTLGDGHGSLPVLRVERFVERFVERRAG